MNPPGDPSPHATPRPLPWAELRESLRKLYASPAAARAWRDQADHGFISTTLIERSIAALAPRLSGRMIDVGCGQQPYRGYFEKMSEVVACDHDASRGNVDFACPADRIPVADGSFDAVLCTEVLEHVPDPLAVWRELHRILRPGGGVLLTTPLYWPPHEEPYDFYRYPGPGLRHLAESAGFSVEELWPRGGMWAFYAQVSMHVLSHYLRAAWMRRVWNRLALRIDAARCNPTLTLGWTVLARKPAAGA
jgi:SAM-dependent methyltransferase